MPGNFLKNDKKDSVTLNFRTSLEALRLLRKSGNLHRLCHVQVRGNTLFV